MQSLPKTLATTFRQENCQITCGGRIVLLHWLGVPSADAAKFIEPALERAKESGQSIFFFAYFEEEAMARETPADVRRDVAKILTTWADKLGGACVIFEKVGFKGAMLRALISGIGLMSRSNFPWAVHANMGEAAAWMLKVAKAEHLSRHEIERLLQDARSAAPARDARNAAATHE
jgi:hypothetical protein